MDRQYIRLAFTLIVLCLFGWYFTTNRAEFATLEEISPYEILLIISCQLGVMLTNCFFLSHMVRMANRQLAMGSAMRVTAYSSIINFFGFFQGGIGYRAYFLKKNFGIPLSRYTAMMGLQYLSVFGLSGLMIAVGLSTEISFSPGIALVSFSTITLSMLAIRYARSLPFLTKGLAYLKDSAILNNPSDGTTMTCIATLHLFSAAMAYYVELSAIGAQFDFRSLLIYTGVSQFSILIAITPGAIGIREGLLILINRQIHISPSDIVLAATIDRLVFFATLALVAPLAASSKNIGEVDRRSSAS